MEFIGNVILFSFTCKLPMRATNRRVQLGRKSAVRFLQPTSFLARLWAWLLLQVKGWLLSMVLSTASATATHLGFLCPSTTAVHCCCCCVAEFLSLLLFFSSDLILKIIPSLYVFKSIVWVCHLQQMRTSSKH